MSRFFHFGDFHLVKLHVPAAATRKQSPNSHRHHDRGAPARSFRTQSSSRRQNISLGKWIKTKAKMSHLMHCCRMCKGQAHVTYGLLRSKAQLCSLAGHTSEKRWGLQTKSTRNATTVVFSTTNFAIILVGNYKKTSPNFWDMATLTHIFWEPWTINLRNGSIWLNLCIIWLFKRFRCRHFILINQLWPFMSTLQHIAFLGWKSSFSSK